MRRMGDPVITSCLEIVSGDSRTFSLLPCFVSRFSIQTRRQYLGRQHVNYQPKENKKKPNRRKGMMKLERLGANRTKARLKSERKSGAEERTPERRR